MRLIFLILLILLEFYSQAQVIPNKGILGFVNNYTVDEYKAARQNFAITQDDRGLMYFANTDEAVLVFDGSNWERIPVPNNSVLSVQYDNGRIWVGAKNDFGYLTPNKTFGLEYKSLLDKVPEKYYGFGNVWQTAYDVKDSSEIFLSRLALFFYKDDTLKIIHIDSVDKNSLFLRLFKVRDDIYFSLKYIGLCKLENDTLQYLKGSDSLWTAMTMLPYKDGKTLVYSFFYGFYTYDGKKFRHIKTDLDNFLIRNVYRAIDIKGKYYAFALVGGGVLITDYNFRPIQLIDVKSGLYNDKVQNMYLDNQDNLWLALDNGIANVRIFTPFTFFDENYGFQKSTKVFAARIFHDTLYVANSDGLVWRRWSGYENKIQPVVEFAPVEGVEQKTFLLREIDNKVFGGNDFGLYYVRGNKAHFLTKGKALINFIRLNSNPGRIIGVKDALQLFEKENGQWVFKTFVKNFKQPIRYVAEDEKGFLWGSEKTAGVYRIYLNDSYDSVIRVIHYNEQNGLHGLPSQYKNFVFQLNDRVIFATTDGLYGYDYTKDEFFPLTGLNSFLGEGKEVNWIYEDDYGNLWIRHLVQSDNNKNWELLELKKTDTGYVAVKAPFYPFRNRIFSVSQVEDSSYIIGTEGGFIFYDQSIPVTNNQQRFRTYIRTVKLLREDSVIYQGFFDQPQDKALYPVIPYKYNNLRFVFAAGYYGNSKDLQFSFYLDGYDKDWSPWTEENVKEYSNLPSGDYTFYVKSRNLYGTQGTTAKFSFVIRPPWYLTVWAFIGYVILAVLIVWLIVYLYTLRLRKQKEYLEEQVRLRTIEIEQQKHEIEVQRDLLAKQNDEIRRKNKDITSSIEYAKRIQTAMLPLEDTIRKYLPEHFILFRPRDIVSGDFYWFAYKDGKIIIAAVDCTGHGVPGAFMSMIGAEILNTIVLTNGVTDAAEILNLQNQYIRTALKQDTTDNQDGMDMALCVIDIENKKLEFAGAKNPLIYIDKNHELHKIRGDRQSIGGYQYTPIVSFKKYIVEIESPMWFYIFSDGFQDQFGGDPPMKFLTKRFYELLHKIHTLPMEEQKQVLERTIEDWMKNSTQTDDILVIGFKL